MTEEPRVRRLDPDEKFIGCDACLRDFWAWAFSDVLANITRAALAEFIVGYALNATNGVRKEWDTFDHEYRNKKIEVKAAGLTQRFEMGKKRSSPSFKIKKSLPIGWRQPSARPGEVPIRSADCYVFCVHTETDSCTANPLDMSSWRFLVIPTEKINEIFGDQKTVVLSVLEKHCAKTNYNGLKAAVNACITK
jgi:hypothetical protein